jgi:pyrimidine operon attenuation protein / uracil phosphoribosyltransferase
MNKQKISILDKEQISHKLQRMAYEVWEHNSDEQAVTLIGIERAGMAVAQSLAERIRKISPLQVDVLSVKMNKRNPLADAIDLQADLTGKSVVLVDDVSNSGKTLLYALRPVLNYETKKILVAVLVERKHKAFPISPDIVGHSVSTTLQEHIEVETDGDTITGAYLS